jgi:transposase
MDPPAHAVVLSIDEKSQIQALERTRPDRPLASGHPAAQTHDYTRHGTTTLFAALDVLAGTVLGRCMQRHRTGEFIRFLNAVEAAVPPGKAIHAILDNVATHKHPKVRAWLARHPRWTFHFTPTSASWLNAVEGFFSALTRRRLRRGSFTGVVDLQAAIKRYIAEHNRSAKPFVWTKPATDILAAVSRSPEPSV